MKFRKIFLILIVLVLSVALVFPGCRKKNPVPQSKNYDGTVLTYYKMFDDEEVMDPIIKEFLVEHPGLKIDYKKFADFDEYQDIILNELAEGEGPDIFSMQNTWFLANRKKLAPMPEKFGGPNDFADTFVEVAYGDLVLTNDEGIERVYALPMTVDTLALYYNKDHFEDRIPSRGKPASTWEGIKEDVLLLNKEDNSFSRFDVAGIAMGRADNITRAVDILYLLFLQHGVDFYNENVSEAIFAKSQGGVSNYPAQEALELFVGFADKDEKHYSWNGLTADPEADEKEIEAFAAGDVSMIMGYSYMRDEILNYIEILNEKGVNTIDESAIRVAPVPQLYDPEVSSEKRVTYGNYFAETVSRNSENAELAWKFLIHLTLRENLDYYFDKLHKPTSRRDMIADQKKDPDFGVFASQIGYAESFSVLDYFRYKEIFANLIGSANVDEASRGDLVEAQDEINLLLPEEGLIVPKAEPIPDEE